MPDQRAVRGAHLMSFQRRREFGNLFARAALRQLRNIGSALLPASKASSISCPDNPNTSLSTPPILTLPSSRIFCVVAFLGGQSDHLRTPPRETTQFPNHARNETGRIMPCRSRCARQRASCGSVLCPVIAFTYCGLASTMRNGNSASSSRTFSTGFQ